MSQSVTIKSNKYGINLILDAAMPFADLIKAVVELSLIHISMCIRDSSNSLT